MNMSDPLGLEGGFLEGARKIGAGLGKLWERAPEGIAEALTKGGAGAVEALGKTADAFATNEDLQNYTGLALGAGALPIVAVGAAKAAPAVVAAAPSLLKQGGKALKSAEKAVKKAAKPLVDKAYANADRVDKVGRAVADATNPNKPPETREVQKDEALKFLGERSYEAWKSQKAGDKESHESGKNRHLNLGWWGR